ncbi:MAG TPA: formate dehydrogenase accessory protein FdhE [Burkholderiales bacterium]
MKEIEPRPDLIQPAGEIPRLRAPERTLFRARAERLRALADGHSLADYLRFLADLAAAQDETLRLFEGVPLPDETQLARCREHRLAPLGVSAWRRAPAWRDALQHILRALARTELPASARAAIERLEQSETAFLERTADALLGGEYERVDRSMAPFVAAALQAYWLHMTATLGTEAFGQLDTPYLCPACGSPPVSSVVRNGANDRGLRYLTCSLCSLQWHAPRIKCVFCEKTDGLSYYAIEGGNGAVKAESCESCMCYLKVMYLEKDPKLDVLADDVASVALDILMSESGVFRNGVNFFLLGGTT